MTEAELSTIGEHDVSEIDSSFDLSYFCIKRETLRSIMTGLGFPEGILEIVRSLRDESIFSCASNWQGENSSRRISEPQILLSSIASHEFLELIDFSEYVLRTERGLPSDLILVVNWTEAGSLVNAFLHGCTQEEATRIHHWLDKAKAALKHPWLPAMIIVEIQLERHSKIYQRYYERYTALYDEIRSKSEQLQLSRAGLRGFNELEVGEWLPQIFRMYQKHRNFQRLLASFRRILDSLVEISGQYRGTSEDLNITGRLREISRLYDDLAEQSHIIADGVSLLLTTVSLDTLNLTEKVWRLSTSGLTK